MNTGKTLRKGFKYRLNPTPQQRELFFLYARAYRFVFNWGLGKIKAIMDTKTEENPRPKLPSAYDLSKELTQLKKLPELSYLNEANAQCLQAALKDLDFAMKNFFRRVKNKEKPGFPRFKSKERFDAFRFPQISFNNMSSSYFKVPKIGLVSYIKDRNIIGIPKTMTIVREGKHWYASISIVMVNPSFVLPPDPAVTIALQMDTSISFILSYHDKEDIIAAPTPYNDEIKRIAGISTSLSRKEKGSANRKDCIERINTIHKTIHQRRKDFLHKISYGIVKKFNTINVRKIDLKKLLETENEEKTRVLTDAGWHMFVNMLKYKAEWHNKYFAEIENV